MNQLLFGEFADGRKAVGLFALRLVTGAAFILHGWPKIQQAFNWMGPDASVPGFLQAAAALAEFGGGIALILGLLTPVAALAIAGTMVTAIGMVHLSQGHPFVNPKGPSYELAAIYLVVTVTLALTGPGKLSLDALLFGKKRTP